MKHIKKKYLFQEKADTFKSKVESLPSFQNVDRRDSKTLKNSKNHFALIKTTDDFFLSGFIHNHNGKHTVVPIPDLTLVYFDHSYQMNLVRKEKENDLFKKLNSKEDVTEDVSNELYHYYGHASNCIISLFTSLESFVNSLIPDNGKFERILKNKTEIFTKTQIQENINFTDKLKFVLPYFFNDKNFFKKQTPTNQLIISLKELRDEVVHTKSEKSFELQEKLFKKILKFKYDKSIEAVAKFMNYYKSDYITECDCGKDF